MMSAVTTAKALPSNNTVLTRLADRWRPVGLYLSCLDKEGNLLWHDSQMPRVLALCLTADAGLQPRIRQLAGPAPAAARYHCQIPWLQLQLIPVMRRRKVSAWIALLARTDNPGPASEDFARLAQRASADAQSLIAQALKTPLVPAALFASLSKVAEQMHEDLQGSSTTNNELANVTEQLSSVYEEISLLYKISSGMRFSQKPQAFLESVCQEIQQIGNVRSVIVSLARHSPDGALLPFTAATTTVGDSPINPSDLLKALAAPIHEALKSGESQIHNALPDDPAFAQLKSSLRRFVCIPLARDRRPLGVMIAVDRSDHSEFTSVDHKLLSNVGNQCSIFLENAALYADMQDLFMGVLHALTRSIDAKDAYTRGHSQRVAELSRALAKKVGLSDEECERVYLSGLLHDVGKIGVPEAVLTKPGRLTDDEFDAIKRHPTIGAQILGNIKQLQDILPGVLYHHERWDGRGYPHGIGGDAIPLLGRIICVADSFDAMSSTRTYRAALPLEKVLGEIKRCGGTQFDPVLADLFVTLDFNPYRQAMEESTRATVTPAPLLEATCTLPTAPSPSHGAHP